jgi:hypothetical protein
MPLAQATPSVSAMVWMRSVYSPMSLWFSEVIVGQPKAVILNEN